MHAHGTENGKGGRTNAEALMDMIPCPHCKKRIREDEATCPFCHEPLDEGTGTEKLREDQGEGE